MHRAVGTAAGFGLLIAIPSTLGFLMVTVDPASRLPLTFGAINLVAFCVVVPTTLLTVPFGVRLAHRLDAGRLKRVFGVFLTLVALRMIYGVFF